DLVRRTEWQKFYRVHTVGRGLNFRTERPLANEDKTYAVIIKQSSGLNYCFPCAIKTQVAGMEHHEGKPATDFLGNRMVLPSHPRHAVNTITNHHHAGGINALGDDAFARVFSQNDDAACPEQSPSVEPLPEPHPPGGTNDAPRYRHLRVKVANVVNERLSFEPSHKCARDAFKGRVGHGHNQIGTY